MTAIFLSHSQVILKSSLSHYLIVRLPILIFCLKSGKVQLSDFKDRSGQAIAVKKALTPLWNLAVSAPRPCAMSDAGSQFPHLSVEGLIFPFPIHAQFAKLPPTRSTFPLSLHDGVNYFLKEQSSNFYLIVF